MTQYPPTGPGYPNPGMMRPHRGTMILVFGILSWLVCIIFGFVAWNMGNSDLAEMDAGRMDPEGRGLTQAGKILGMIHAIVFLCAIAMVVLVFVGMALLAAVGAAASGP